MIEVTGDVWANISQAKVIMTNAMTMTNGAAVMGAGTAKFVRDNYPTFPFLFGDRLNRTGNRVYVFPLNGVSRVFNCSYLFTYPTKYNWRRPASLELIRASARQLRDLVDGLGLEQIQLVRPGCGENTGRLDWSTVRFSIEDYLDDRFTVYHMEEFVPSNDDYEKGSC